MRTLTLWIALALIVAGAGMERSARAESSAPEDAAAQPGDRQVRWTLQVDPLTTALGYVHVQVERALSERLSIYVGPHLRLFPGLLSESDEDFLGLGIEAGVRYFLRPSAPRGAWAQVRGVAARITDDDDSAVGGYVSALIGYTFILKGRWVLSVGIGGQYIRYSINDQGTEGFLPAAHSTLGVAF